MEKRKEFIVDSLMEEDFFEAGSDNNRFDSNFKRDGDKRIMLLH